MGEFFFFFFLITKIKWILQACLVELVYEWRSFWLSFYSLFKLENDSCLCTWHNCPVFSHPCTGLLCWLGLRYTQTLFIHGLDEYSLGFIPSYALDGVTLGLLFVYLFFQGKLMNDTSLRPRVLFVRACLPLVDHSGWMHKRIKDSHTTMYILENTSYIYISENPNLCKHSSIGMAHAQELVP